MKTSEKTGYIGTYREGLFKFHLVKKKIKVKVKKEKDGTIKKSLDSPGIRRGSLEDIIEEMNTPLVLKEDMVEIEKEVEMMEVERVARLGKEN